MRLQIKITLLLSCLGLMGIKCESTTSTMESESTNSTMESESTNSTMESESTNSTMESASTNSTMEPDVSTTDYWGSGDINDTTTIAETPTTTVKTTTTDCPIENTDQTCKCGQGEVIAPYQLACAVACDPDYLWCEQNEKCKKEPESDTGFECTCATGFYSSEGGCEPGKFFGGSITFKDPYDEINEDTTKSDIKNILVKIYNTSGDLIDVEVLSVRNGCTIAEYQLTCKEKVTTEDVYSSFNNYTSDCSNGTKESQNMTLDCTASKNTVISPGLLCEQDQYNDTCGENTKCTTPEGLFLCSCVDGYTKVTDSSNFCVWIKCDKNDDCNPPFGECKTGGEESQNYCSCIWGFSGENCQDSWEFTFTIVSAGLGIILIILITVLICNKKKFKSHKEQHVQEDLNLKNPFIDFQPGLVRAKLPTSMHSVSDTLDMRETNGNSSNKRNSYTNGAYAHANEDPYRLPQKSSTFQHQNDYQSATLSAPTGADYF